MKFTIISIAGLLLLGGICRAQSTVQEYPNKGYAEELNYLRNMYYGSRNPVSMFHTAVDYASFSASYGSEKGKFHHPDQGLSARNWNCDIYGITVRDRIAFEGSITYDNDKYFDKKWSSKLFLSPDNPFFLGDIIPTDYESQKFRLKGGVSYKVTPRLIAGIMGDYSVGTLADQFDPRGKNKGIKFAFVPGLQYSFGNFTAGISGEIGKHSEEMEFIKIGSITSTEYMYMFRGLINPETFAVTNNGAAMDYSGLRTGAAFQLSWDNKKNAADFLEISYITNSTESLDAQAGVGTRKNTGDYGVKEFSVRNRFRITGERIMHNIFADFSTNTGDAVSYVLEFIHDEYGQPVWAVRSKSVTYRKKCMEGGASYRFDLMKAGIPGFTAEIGGRYNDTDITNYPENYFQRYSSVMLKADVSKAFDIGANMLKATVSGYYKNVLGTSSEDGVTLERVREYFDMELAYSAAAYWQAGLRVDYYHSLNLTRSSFNLGVFAETWLRKYNGRETILSGADRWFFRAGVSLLY